MAWKPWHMPLYTNSDPGWDKMVDKQEGARRSKYYAPQLWITCVTWEQWIWETNYRNIMVTEHVPKSYKSLFISYKMCAVWRILNPTLWLVNHHALYTRTDDKPCIARTYWNIHMSEATSKKEYLPLETVLQKLFHLLEKIMTCNNDTHCISKGKIGHIRAWNSRVIQL